ncbi:hypothetical protein D9756_009155 [Leucocoprinus leucothites]|uniref:Uncharacterized protein n=1 Tax=Leucocoprinus leucothites TaxID=201217 RepID=A0A8H5CZK7_9AGAR|nr:hypothetical protein D9756_009155 [Leucoagaricus leucothites]
MFSFIRLLNLRLLVVSSIAVAITWLDAFHTGTIQDPVYFYNSQFNLGVYSPFVFIVLSVEIFVRHTLTKWCGESWLNIYELVSLLVEVSIGLYYTIAVTSSVDGRARTRDELLVSTYVMMGCIGISLLCLAWDLFRNRAKSGLLKPFHILGGIPKHSRPPPNSLFFGQFLFTRRYRRESSMLRMLRGIIAGVMLLCFGVVACFALIFQPFQSEAPSLVKEFHMSQIALQNQGLLTYQNWIINIQSDFDDSRSDSDWKAFLLNSTQVKWRSSIHPDQNSQFCTNSTHLKDAVSFTCPTSFTTKTRNDQNMGNAHYVDPLDAILPENAFSEITIFFNFSNVPRTSPTDHSSWQGVRIAVSLESSAPLSSTSIIPLVPSSQLIGFVSMEFVQKFANVGTAAFGWRKYLAPIPVVKVDALLTDPSPPELQQKQINSASLRLVPLRRGGSQAEYRLVQDDKENSMLSGVALLGGLWTFLNGAFAVIFGSTLLLILFGIKPLSIYGLAHMISGNKNSLAEGSVLSHNEQQRIVALLREHLMDVGTPEENDIVQDIESYPGVRMKQ